jgi:hypothetical protein
MSLRAALAIQEKTTTTQVDSGMIKARQNMKVDRLNAYDSRKFSNF